MSTASAGLLHSSEPLPRRWINRIFFVIYALALSLLLLKHSLNVVQSPSLITISLFLADMVLSFMWVTSQAFHFNPVQHRLFLESLTQRVRKEEYPPLDVFICTADPIKEPPIGVVNTVLSVMAYEYPTNKLSVYVSDDGGSMLTLFALIHGVKFARHWIAYCKKRDIIDRSPEVYFEHDHAWFPETAEIKMMYENLKSRVESGGVCPDTVADDQFVGAFRKWTPDFTCRQHPPVIEILLNNNKDKDVAGDIMPNLIYVSREKNKNRPHNFKAGALNVLLRVSGTITDAPLVLILDCDMYSNDPKTPLRALCYFMDPNVDAKLGFVQFPQRFHSINKNDIYASEFKFETQILSLGMDGLLGFHFMGTGAFFRRHVLCPKPTTNLNNKISYKTLQDNKTKHDLTLAHDVASCEYEENTNWGSTIGFRYGTLTEDFYTSFRLHCEGWTSVLCNPKRAAFLGGAPSTLNDSLTQIKRWYLGFLEIFFSKYCPITFGIQSMNPLQALCYANYTLRPFWSIPIIIYAFLPQLSLAKSMSIFPKVSEVGFFLYAFLFLGAYGKDFFDFVVFGGGSVEQWLNYERMWMIWGLSSYPFALFEWSLKSLGISTTGFNVTSKVTNEEQSKRYAQGVFEFGVESPLILAISIASVLNLLSFVKGGFEVLTKNGGFDEMFMQMFISGVAVVQSWPIYEAMVLRNDNGKMPLKVTLTSIVIALVMYLVASYVI